MSNRRSILLLLAGIAILSGLHILASLRKMGEPLVKRTSLMDAAAASAERITLSRPGAPDLVLESADGWKVVSPFSAPAEPRTVLRLLDAMATARVQTPITERELGGFGKSPEDYGLGEGAIRVAVETPASKEEVSIGSQTAAGDGVFASRKGDGMIYIVETNALAAADLPPSAFRLATICPEAAAEADSFDLKRGSGTLETYKRDGEIWVSVPSGEGAAPKPASSSRIRSFLSSLASSQALEFVWPVGAEGEPKTAGATLLAGYGLDPESVVALTFRRGGRPDGQIAFGKDAGGGRSYALVQNGGAVVLVDSRLRELAAGADFLDPRLFPCEAQDVERISASDGGVEYVLARDGAAWRLETPVAAPADAKNAGKFLETILSLTPADRDEAGVKISVSSNLPPQTVSRPALLANISFEDLRSTEILPADSGRIRRLSGRIAGAKTPSVVSCDGASGQWTVESSARSGSVSPSAVDAISAIVPGLRAEKIVALKSSQADLKRYGLETPAYTLGIDFAESGSQRKNILIGEKSQGGYFATLGAFDAVFVISAKVAKTLMQPLVTQ